MMEFKIDAQPFSWTDRLAETAIEDFESYQKDMSYGASTSIGLALAKLKMIEEGYLVELPCKPGDTVYYIYMDCPEDYKREYCTDHEGSCEQCPHRVGKILSKKYTLRDIGNPVYLTYQEAKEALEGMKE